jgi:hypothetical protein
VALGPATVDGAAVEQVRVVSGAIDITLGLAPSGRIHSATFRDRNIDGAYGTYTLVYFDSRTVGTLQLPFSVRASFEGQPDAARSVTIDAASLDTPLDASLFAPNTPGER